MNSIVVGVNLGLLLAALGAAIVMIDHMGARTRGAMRWGAVLLFVGSVAEVLGYLWHWANWTDTLFFGGAAMCVVANLRFPSGTCAPNRELTPAERARARWKADLYAYLVGALTAAGLAAAWLRG